MDQAYEAGELFWDSADVYGDNEDLIGTFQSFSSIRSTVLTAFCAGKWFERNPGKRENIFLATKFANYQDADGNRAVSSTPEYCKQSIEKSLKRLGLPYVDLYYVHRLDRKTPIEKTMEALKELKNEGKIKYIGLSEMSAESLRRACKVEHVDAVQIEYSCVPTHGIP